MKITKAVIPVAGLGTRFLPATKAIPKELIPLVDRPVLQWVVEEAVTAGIREIIFVISPQKDAVRQHFSADKKLEAELKRRGKTRELAAVRRVTRLAKFHFVTQGQARGDGDAVRLADRYVRGATFAVLFGDDVVTGGRGSAIGELVTLAQRVEAPVVALAEVSRAEVHRYGIVQGHLIGPRQIEITRFVEKPSVKTAPSRFAAIGRYILTPHTFRILRTLKPDRHGEIRIAGIWDKWFPEHSLYGYVVSGKWYRCGEPEGWLRANCELANVK